MGLKLLICCEQNNKFSDIINKTLTELKKLDYQILNESDFKCNKELIDSCDWVIFLMTQESVSQDSHCLRQLQYAKDKNKRILPIMLEKVDIPPMSLQGIQWVAFTRWIDDEGNFDQKYFEIRIKEIDDDLQERKKQNLIHKVFISYGHDKYADLLVKKIAHDLKEKKMKVWIDYDYLYGSVDWEFKIQEGIDHCRYVLFFVTEHSMRRPKGYCLNEIIYSRSKDKKIIPVSIQDIDTPISIITTPQIDFGKSIKPDGTIDQEIYNKAFEKIYDVLSGNTELALIDEVYNAFAPLNNEHYIEPNPKFYGREWLIDKYTEWLKNEKSKVFCLLGNAGCGKSAFVSYLADKQPNIHAIHFCIHNNSDRANPKKAILSLSYHLSKQIPEYRDLLYNLPTLRNLEETKNSIALFEYLFINPLWDLEYDEEKNGPLVVIIDALDETTKTGELQNDFINLIVNEFKKTPPWFKLVVTSRPEADIKRKLEPLQPVFIDTESNLNISDIKGYLDKYLIPFISDKSKKEQEDIINTLINKSEGNFVYISKVMEEIEKDPSKIKDYKNFPQGLKNKFTEYFERLFKDGGKYDYEKDVRPLMDVLCSQYEPLNYQTLSKILNVSEIQLFKIGEHLSSVFDVKDNCLLPFHKSLFDWLPSTDAGTFRVDVVNGNSLIANYLLPKYESKQFDDYIIKHLIKHCIDSDKYEIAMKLLDDKELLDKRMQLLGSDLALERYFHEIYLLYQKNKDYGSVTMMRPTFLDVFGKYRKIIAENEIYYDIAKMQFGGIAINHIGIKNLSLDVSMGLGYYYMSYGNYATALNALGLYRGNVGNESKQPLDSDIIAEKNNMLGFLLYHAGCFERAKELLQHAAHYYYSKEHLTINDYYEAIRAYASLGDVNNLESKKDKQYYYTSLNIVEEAKQIVTNPIERKILKQLELSTVVRMLESEIWSSLDAFKIFSNQFVEYSKYKQQILALIKDHEDLKIFNQTYVRCLCIEMLLNVFEGNEDLIHQNYNNITSMHLSTENTMFVEFIYALFFYLKGNMPEANSHLKLSFDKDISAHRGHNVALTKIAALSLVIANQFSVENLHQWFTNITILGPSPQYLDGLDKLKIEWIAKDVKSLVELFVIRYKYLNDQKNK